MPNRYEIRGDVTVLFMGRKVGDVIECLIDTEELDHVLEFPNRWFANKSRRTNVFYVHGHFPTENGRRRKALLHRWILRLDDPFLQVDHINRNPLDNRRVNLRVVTNAMNGQNRDGAYASNKSSQIRGVHFRDLNRFKKWSARITVDGKELFLGYYETQQEADFAAAIARAKCMPYSAENAVATQVLHLLQTVGA